MAKLSYVKKVIITSGCIALSVVLPMAFHAIPNAASIYSPMHIPVLLCGLICGWPFGLLCGLAGPVLSALFTQMPPIAYLPSIVVELATYGMVSGILMRFVRTKRIYVDLYISLIVALFAGRVVAGAFQSLIFVNEKYSAATWITSYFVTAWPGIVIHLALIPVIVVSLEKARLIPFRYPDKR